MSFPRIFLTAFLVVLSVVSGLQAQQATGTPELNTKHIPESAFAAVALFPQQLKTDKQFEMFPFEILAAWGKRELGIDPMAAQQITLIAQAPSKAEALKGRPIRWAAIMHFKAKQKLGGITIDQLKKGDPEGKIYINNMRHGVPSFLVANDKTIIIGDEAWFDDLQKADDSGLGKQMKAAVANRGNLVAVFDIEKSRPLLVQAFERVTAKQPSMANRLQKLPELLDRKMIRLDLTSGLMRVQLDGIDAVPAERTKEILTEAMRFAADFAIGDLAAQLNGSNETLVKYFKRLSGIIQRDLEPKIEGNKVTIKLESLSNATVSSLIGLLLPGVQATRTASQRAMTKINMRLLALSCVTYEEFHKHLPTQANYDNGGKPLLSWRVHILPYLEHKGLYEQFHLDEPWDSEHNKKLIEKMPDVYQSPGVAVPIGKTVYLGVAGTDGVFNKNKITLADITDGTSKTAAVVEVNRELAVEWTRPQDYECNPKNPLKGLGNVQPDGFLVALFSGRTRLVANSIDPEVWKNLCQMNDGNAVDF